MKRQLVISYCSGLRLIARWSFILSTSYLMGCTGMFTTENSSSESSFGRDYLLSESQNLPWTVTQVSQGSFDYPMRTYWNGTEWDWLGTEPAPPVVDQANCYSWEITGHGRFQSMTSYTPDDFSQAVSHWSMASGFQAHFRNAWSSVVQDGTLNAIQIVPSIVVGQVWASSTPECDGPGGDLGHGQFAVILPPKFNIARSEKYGIVFVSPGSGSTAYDQVIGLSSADLRMVNRMAKLSGQSVGANGRGVIIIVGSAGGQGSGGVSEEYAKAVNEFFLLARQYANADTNQVIMVGGSRGGGNALFHSSRPGRTYRVIGTIASVPALAYGSLGRLSPNLIAYVHHFYATLTCFIDTDCTNSWRWDHQRKPATEPNAVLQTLTGSPTFVGADQRSAIGQSNWDKDNFVEICTAPRDWVSGAGISRYYYDNLPSNVRKRLSSILIDGHGPANSDLCFDHMTIMALDRLAKRSDYWNVFARDIKPGIFYERLTLLDSTPYAYLPAELEREQISPIACGDRPPYLHVPWKHQLKADGTVEPGSLVVNGQPGRLWRAALTESPGSDVEIGFIGGRLGSDNDSTCSSFPEGNAGGTLCRYIPPVAECKGASNQEGVKAVCGYRFWFDCNGDDVLEPIDESWTPYVVNNEQAPNGVSQPLAQLWVTDYACAWYGDKSCTPDSLLGQPAGGFPVSISPCLRMDRNDCSPW